MSALIEQHDWATSPLGSRDAWSSSLRTLVDMMLASGHAMCLVWGGDRTLLYNDGNAPFLGARHPAALGRSFRDVWEDVWDDIGPLVERAYAGETTTLTDMPLVMMRNGYPEATWWDFSYSPVRDDQWRVAGLLDVASDSTGRVMARQERHAAEARLRDSETFMRSVLAASTDCIKVIGLDGRLSFMSEGGMKVMEVGDFAEVNGCEWPDLLQQGAGPAKAAIAAAKEGRSSHFETTAETVLGTPRYWSVSVSPIIGEDGEVQSVLAVSRDHTALEQARTRQRMSSIIGSRIFWPWYSRSPVRRSATPRVWRRHRPLSRRGWCRSAMRPTF